jgi:hypothetical protein
MPSLNNAHMVGKRLEMGGEHFSAAVDGVIVMLPR